MIETVGDLRGITDTRAGQLLQLQRTACNLVLSLAFATGSSKSIRTNERNFLARTATRGAWQFQFPGLPPISSPKVSALSR